MAKNYPKERAIYSQQKPDNYNFKKLNGYGFKGLNLKTRLDKGHELTKKIYKFSKRKPPNNTFDEIGKKGVVMCN